MITVKNINEYALYVSLGLKFKILVNNTWYSINPNEYQHDFIIWAIENKKLKINKQGD
jgi:hypothetical protein